MFTSLVSSASQISNNLIDYQNAVNVISANAYAVTKIEVPVLSFDQKDVQSKYDQVKNNLVSAKKNALSWQIDLVPRLQAVPESVSGFDDDFQLFAFSAKSDLSRLIQNPNDKQSLASLKEQLDQLITGLNLRIKVVKDLQTDLGNFSSNLATTGTNLKTSVTFIYSIKGAEEDEIRKIQESIKKLKKQLKKYQIELGFSIAGTVIGVILIGTFVFAPIGLAVTAASVVGIIETDAEIKITRAELKAATESLNPLNQNLAQLQNLSDSVNDLVVSNQAAQQAMAAVLETWNELAADLQKVAQDVEKADATTDWSAAQATIQSASQEWTTTKGLADQLAKITYNFDSTPVAVS